LKPALFPPHLFFPAPNPLRTHPPYWPIMTLAGDVATPPHESLPSLRSFSLLRLLVVLSFPSTLCHPSEGAILPYADLTTSRALRSLPLLYLFFSFPPKVSPFFQSHSFPVLLNYNLTPASATKTPRLPCGGSLSKPLPPSHFSPSPGPRSTRILHTPTFQKDFLPLSFPTPSPSLYENVN